MGMYTLSIMTEMSHSSYIAHAESFAVLFTNTLNGLTQPYTNLGYYTVITMKNLVPIMGGHQQVCFLALSNPTSLMKTFPDDKCLSSAVTGSLRDY